MPDNAIAYIARYASRRFHSASTRSLMSTHATLTAAMPAIQADARNQ